LAERVRINTYGRRWRRGGNATNVKQWLNRARNIDKEINHLIEQRDEERSRLLSITQKLTGDTVQSTKDPHKFDRLVEYEVEIDRQIDELIRVKTEILKAISKLTDGRYREILRLRYLEAKTFEQIAVEMNYSWRHVCTLHGRALIRMEVVINDLVNGL